MHIIFDVDDTLYDQTQPFKRAFQTLWEKKYQVDVDELYKVSRKYSNQIFDLVMNNTMSVDDSGVYRMRKAMNDFNYQISEEEALQFQLCYRHNQGHITMSETMKAILDYCVNEEVTLAVLTNGMSEHQRKKIAGLGLQKWMDETHFFVSDELRVSKPDAKAFHHIQNKLHLNPEQTYYVGDSYEHDIVGANSAGWKTIYLNRRNNPVEMFQVKPDYVVNNEEELFSCIQNIVEKKKD